MKTIFLPHAPSKWLVKLHKLIHSFFPFHPKKYTHRTSTAFFLLGATLSPFLLPGKRFVINNGLFATRVLRWNTNGSRDVTFEPAYVAHCPLMKRRCNRTERSLVVRKYAGTIPFRC